MQSNLTCSSIHSLFVKIIFLSITSFLLHLSLQAQHVTLSTANCVMVSAQEAQFDVVVVNDGNIALKFASATIRGTMSNATSLMGAGNPGTVSWGFVPNSCPTSWPINSSAWPNAVPGSFSYNVGTGAFTFTSSPTYFTTQTAPTLPFNVPVTIGRIFVKITGGTFAPNASLGWTWLNTATGAGITAYQNNATTVTSLQSTNTITRVNGCANTMLLNQQNSTNCISAISVSNIINPSCNTGTGSATLNLLPSINPTPGTYTLNGGPAINYNTNPITLTGLSVGTHTLVLSNAPTCTPLTTIFTISASTPSNIVTNATACSSYTWPQNGVTYTTNQTGLTIPTTINGCPGTATLNLTLGVIQDAVLSTTGNASSTPGSISITENLNNNNILFATTCNYAATILDSASGTGAGSTNLNTIVESFCPYATNGQRFGPRHFTVNATNSESGQVTLYLTQADFNLYNAAASSFVAMNVNSVKIAQVIGGLSNGVINNLVTTANWNASLNRFEISATVQSLNGEYYVYTDNTCNAMLSTFLPLNISFNQITITWPSIPNINSYQLRYRKTGTLIWSMQNTLSNTTTLLNLASSTSYQIQGRIKCTNNTFGNWGPIFVFNTTATPCVSPSLIINNISNNSAQVNWASVQGASSYSLRYRMIANPANPWINVNGLLAPGYTLTNLANNAIYEVQGATFCSASNALSTYSNSVLFNTSTSCIAPMNIIDTLTTSIKSTIKWQAVPGALSYMIRYKKSSTMNWLNTQSTSNSKLIMGLSPSTTYNVEVKTNCSNTNVSSWSSYSFTTPVLKPSGSSNNNNDIDESINIFPNPSSGKVNIDFSLAAANNIQLKVIDLDGRVLKIIQGKYEVGPQHIEIDLSELSDALYVIQLFEGNELKEVQKIKLMGNK